MPLALQGKLFGEEFPMSKVCGRFAEWYNPINSFGWLDRRSFRNWKPSCSERECLKLYNSVFLFEATKLVVLLKGEEMSFYVALPMYLFPF
ncbi:uncharacterized protein TNCT_385951 [Trichonephila clavata]|uniref:Uncharacterized protein n=1 Tax=Trichonephila clavata TaxID=2740835 RepID=A0A8X6GU09_TRICU|nr:uncharacterized protein TNCT_385951 [Trichonephila clavata]